MTTAVGPVRRTAALFSAAALLAACQAHARPRLTPLAHPATHPAGTTQAPTATPPPTPTARPSSARSVVTHRLAAIARRLPPGAISVAALNTRTGDTYEWGARRVMWMGSVYKLFVLEALLLQRQDSGGWLSGSELADVTAMIEQSDNRAGYRMYLDVGGSAALAVAAKRLGLRHTRIGRADPALTTTDARDGITLLRHLVRGGPLSAHSKAFVLTLMRDVQADQRWGVGAVADRDSRFANKNGWMQVDNDNGPGEDDDDRWLVDSLGIVRVHGQRLLMAIFTKHNPDCYTGIDLVQTLARTSAPAVLQQ
jgi:beta-lactamase class A